MKTSLLLTLALLVPIGGLLLLAVWGRRRWLARARQQIAAAIATRGYRYLAIDAHAPVRFQKVTA